MVKELAIRLALNLGEKLQVDDDEIEVYAYGLEILLCSIVKILFLFGLAIFFHLFLPTLLVLLGWIAFRVPGGGAHMETYSHCLSTGLFIMLGLALLSTVEIDLYGQLVLWFFTTILALVCIVRWVPAGTSKKQVLLATNRRKQKVATSKSLFVWFILVLYMVVLGFGHSAQALALGACGGLYGITPIGYRSLEWLDRSITKMERRERLCSER